MFRKLAVLVFSGAAAATSFNGTGQVRTMKAPASTATDLGCLTDAGAWTANDTACGTFTADHNSESTQFTISSASGPCLISSRQFNCSSANDEGATFWAFSGVLSDYDILAYGESITFATSGNASLAPASIHIYSASDSKPWVWLTWESSSDSE
ncbi:hypothetical protein BX600DRAFT_511785 [Xylariales sp. PMI_506]|nr:hypothetical protein BX600DRAFT_511785 [Xylariales sp. PMI_506]